MVPTIRLVWMIALGAPLWLIALSVPGGWVVASVYLVSVGLISARQYRSLPDESSFEVRRICGRMSLGAPAEIRVLISNRSRQACRLTVREELPAGLDDTPPPGVFALAGRRTAEWSYALRPKRRGRYVLSDLVVRVGRPRGLVESQLRLPARDEIRVYPRFATSDEYRLLARINQREEASRRSRRIHGRGTEFESLSRYNRGDDLRTVDWKASAKRGYLVSRNLQTERGQQISLMIDGGRLMAEKIGPYSRFEHALNAAVMLSYVAQKRGDTVAVATFSDRIESFTPPMRGKTIVRAVLEALSQVQVRSVESDYWQVVGSVMARLKRRSLLVMMTDVLDAEASAGLINNMLRARRRHLVLCVVLTEPRLSEIADSTPSTVQQVYLKAAACHLKLQRHLAMEKMRGQGILVIETTPEQLTVDLIRRYLEIRKADLQ